MPARPRLRRTLAALACGWSVGIAVAAAIELLSRKTGPVSLSVGEELWFSLVFGLFHGAMVIAICVPCWLALRRLGRTGWFEAIVLGFVATFTLEWLLSLRIAAPDLTLHAAMYAAAGAAGGLVTWLVGEARRR